MQFVPSRYAINSTNLKQDFVNMSSGINHPVDLFALNAMKDFPPMQKDCCTKKQHTKYIKSIFKTNSLPQ